nr:uncharacterized protein LOC129387790 [Dermacentor andersoni]
MYEFQDPNDGHVQSLYVEHAEQGRFSPPSKRRRSYTLSPRCLILLAATVLIVGLFVATVVLIIVSRANESGDCNHGDDFSEVQLELTQFATRATEHVVTFSRTRNRSWSGNRSILADEVAARDRPGRSLVDISSAPSEGDEVTNPRTRRSGRGRSAASRDVVARRYRGGKVQDVVSHSSRKFESETRWTASASQDGPLRYKSTVIKNLKNVVQDVAGSPQSQKDAVEARRVKANPELADTEGSASSVKVTA